MDFYFLKLNKLHPKLGLLKAVQLLYGIITTLILCSFWSCEARKPSAGIAGDLQAIDSGKVLFNQYCRSCHGFKADGIGPKLTGLTKEASIDWIKNFIKDPKKIIESQDTRAVNSYKQFKSFMPPFSHFSESELNNIISFIHSKRDVESFIATSRFKPEEALENPIPDAVEASNIVIDLEFITQIPQSNDNYPHTRINKLDFQPQSDDLFMVDLQGKLYRLRGEQAIVYLDMAKERSAFINNPGLGTGFGSFTFHPEFTQNGLLFTSHTEGGKSDTADFKYSHPDQVSLQWVLTEWRTDDPTTLVFTGTSREIMRINFVGSIHGVQEITFNPLAQPGQDDYGLLYVNVGEGGCVTEGYPELTGDSDKIWGSIIRIDPAGNNSTNGNYGIPITNPYFHTADSSIVKEIYAYGFRNPHRLTWSNGGLMLATNIGHNHTEHLNIISPGDNFGWPEREGTFIFEPNGDLKKVYPLPADDSVYHYSYPAAQYDHDEGSAISGGYEYTGALIPILKEKYVFGDIVSGRLFYVEVKELRKGHQASISEWKIAINGELTTLTALCGGNRVDLRLGRDHQGELYIFTKRDGKVYKLSTEFGVTAL